MIILFIKTFVAWIYEIQLYLAWLVKTVFKNTVEQYLLKYQTSIFFMMESSNKT